jgi:hypothetical protein
MLRTTRFARLACVWCVAAGKKAEAGLEYQTALKSDAKNASARQKLRRHLEVAHSKAGNKDGARTELPRASLLSSSFPQGVDAKRTLDALGR